MPMMMGLDFGTKRMGIALADERMKVATPHDVLEIRSRAKTVAALCALVEEYGVQKIVVGLPKTMKGEIGPAAENVIAEFERLKKEVPGEWILWDERLTSKEVERVLIDADVKREKRKEIRDSLAAQRILQGYLEFSHR